VPLKQHLKGMLVAVRSRQRVARLDIEEKITAGQHATLG